MLNLIAATAAAALSTAPQPSADCRAVSVYFESERADLTTAAAGLVDTVYDVVGSETGAGVTATLTGHIAAGERTLGLTSLDEERVAAVWIRFQSLLAGQGDPWSFTVRSMDDTAPASTLSDREYLNRRVELSVCPTPA